MAEPTSALTIEDLILRVAYEIGIAYHGSDGEQPAMVPIDAHDIDFCRRIVNDGIRQFIQAAPKNGWRWMRRIMSVNVTATRITGTADAADSTSITDLTLADTFTDNTDLVGFYIYIITGTGEGSYAQITGYTALTGAVTVDDWLSISGNAGGTDPVADDTFAITSLETIEGDTHRYPLPENFYGTVDGMITYAANTNHSPVIEWRDEAFLRQRRSITIITGYAKYAAIVQYEPRASGAGPTRRFEIQFDPQPSGDDTLEFPYSLGFDGVKLETGTSSAGDETSLTDSNLANLYPDDYYSGWVIKIISGTGKFSNAIVTSYIGSTGKFIVADWLHIDGSVGGTDPSSSSDYVTQPVVNMQPAGYRFDEVVESSCMAKAETLAEDLAGRGFVEKFYKVDTVLAQAIDARSAPRSVGTMNKSGRSPRRAIRGGTTWNDVTFN